MGLVGGLIFFSLGQDKSSYPMFYAGCLSHKGCVCMSVHGVCFKVFFIKSILMYVNVFIVNESRGF
jgi:hypothetical protein